MSKPCLRLMDVEERLKLVLQWFGNDTTEFMIHLSFYLHNHLRQYRPHLPKMLTYEGDQGKQGEEKKKEEKKFVTSMEPKDTSTADSDFLFNTLMKAMEDGAGVDLLQLLMENAKPRKGKVTHDELKEAQKIRRASTLGSISAKFTSTDGRKLSAVEKNDFVIGEAIKLAEAEEVEEEQFDEENDYEEFAAGDEIVVIEGENCGLFGRLQHSSEGIFGLFGDDIKEDGEGNYGVDIFTDSGGEEGYWIHPEALRLKKYVAGQPVKVIDGLNKGRSGVIQVDGIRLRFDDGAYGVDVTMDDGSIEGYWIHPKSMEPVEKEAKEEVDDELNLDEMDKYEYLPYIPYPGDLMDEALADSLNTYEIDINIKRLVTRNNNVVYRYGGKRHLVRYIHGVLLVLEKKEWCELLPILRKLAGLPAVENDLFTKGKKD